MPSIRPCPLPPQALLARYAGEAGYADCYSADLERSVTHAQFVEAFYTGGAIRIERRLIGLFLGRPSTDAELRELAAGTGHEFAAWRVEARAEQQLLLCDVGGRTRSWLMVAPAEPAPGTRLYFGSAVVPRRNRSGGAQGMGIVFAALLGFHRLYSRVLLGSARDRLARAGR